MPTIVAAPWEADREFFRWFFGFELPEVTISDQRLAHSWSFSSPEPQAAAQLLDGDAGLRSALVAAAAAGIRAEQTKFLVLVLELQGDRVAALGGPKLVGRQPFTDLEGVATTLAAELE